MAENKVKTLIPENWPLNKAGREFAMDLGMNQDTVIDQVACFIDWQHAKGLKYVNHDATWREHCRRWAKDNPRPKDDNRPLTYSTPLNAPEDPASVYPCKPGSLFTLHPKYHSDGDIERLTAWRLKTIAKLNEIQGGGSLREPRAAALWMQQEMMKASYGRK